MRISDWSSDVCSSDLHIAERHPGLLPDDPKARARAIEWLFAALNSVETPITERFYAAVIECNESWADARLPMVDDRVRGRLADLSQRLSDADLLDGDFSVGEDRTRVVSGQSVSVRVDPGVSR